MLSDEEKKAIEDLKEVIDLYNDKCLITTEDDFKSIEILLNLIDKQSKEIEELKKKPTFLIKDIYSPKLKEISLQDVEGLIEQGREEVREEIKAKIEEYDDKGMTVNLSNRSAGKTFQQAVHYEVKKVLQSLLEKE